MAQVSPPPSEELPGPSPALGRILGGHSNKSQIYCLPFTLPRSVTCSIRLSSTSFLYPAFPPFACHTPLLLECFL